MSATETIEAEGHLIDSGHLSAIFDKVIEYHGAFEILLFDIGRTNDQVSRIQMRLTTADARTLETLLQELTGFGCHTVAERDAKGRMVSMLEGGYSLSALGRSAVQHIKVMAGLA